MSIPARVRTGRVVVVVESGVGARVGVLFAPPASGSLEALPIVFLGLAADCDASEISRLKRWLVSRAPLRVCRDGDVVELLQPRTGQHGRLRYKPRPLLARQNAHGYAPDPRAHHIRTQREGINDHELDHGAGAGLRL